MKDFTLYPEAFELKKLGFDEPCFFAFDNCSYPMRCSDLRTNEQKFNGVNYNSSPYTSQPTYSQAFRWFREKYDLRSFVDTRVYDVDSPNKWIHHYQVKMGNGIDTQPFYSGDFNTYEDAELACLKKLIEIVKTNEIS